MEAAEQSAPVEGERRPSLGGMRLLAGALLVVMSGLYLTAVLNHANGPAWGYLRAFAEANPEATRGVRGRGLLLGLVIADETAASTLSRRALEAGVLANVTAGNVLRLFPALNIPEEELFGALETVLGLIAS